MSKTLEIRLCKGKTFLRLDSGDEVRVEIRILNTLKRKHWNWYTEIALIGSFTRIITYVQLV